MEERESSEGPLTKTRGRNHQGGTKSNAIPMTTSTCTCNQNQFEVNKGEVQEDTVNIRRPVVSSRGAWSP